MTSETSLGYLYIEICTRADHVTAILKIDAVVALASLELESPDPPLEPDVTNRTPEYRAKFALGKIPAFESAGGSFRLVESDAIAFYLAGLAKDPAVRTALLGGTPEESALVQQWTSFSGHHLEPTLLLIAGFSPAPPGSQRSEEEERVMADWARWMSHLEAHLKGDDQAVGPRKWLVPITGGDAECPSVGDIAVASCLWGACRVFMDSEIRRQYPESIRWLQQIRKMPQVAKVYPGAMIGEEKA